MTTPNRRIVVIEDDPTLREALRYNLVSEGYEIETAEEGIAGLEIARDSGVELVLLDLMLPGMSGLDVCRSLRQGGSVVPILMLTARDTELDRVVGLEVGADDYITKPFSMRELLARVASTLRRIEMDRSAAAHLDEQEILEFDSLTIDIGKRQVSVDGEQVELRLREFDLLAYLASRPGRPFTRDTLLSDVWGYDYLGNSRTVDVHIRWLRMKIEREPSHPTRLVTSRGVGYRFEP
ncbi:MAG TPA: response regulator transcription factor [Dehalococcoidia bacterium]|nr:DNA-binding response regulator [Chloroflexota bacterium]MDP5877236.1 response regulator transcription factor [Dehalococcoidia bacterium]MDP7159897.1 response regulator transcription factor [Dehalococcoidia bacterium]MDP7212487.1 response regulator transcription factor [Dehalococcoidia bacterium]MDP7513719.1 response regulator transcription factor [Dehalococcoidia bacterium]